MTAYVRQEMHGEFIALSIALAFVGAYTAINICDQFRLCVREKSKFLSRNSLKILMALNFGGIAVWSMHFVGKFCLFSVLLSYTFTSYNMCLHSMQSFLWSNLTLIITTINLNFAWLIAIGMCAVKLYSPVDGSEIEVEYRIDYTIISLIVVVIFSYVGIYTCATDAAFAMDKINTIDEFVKKANNMSIQEIRNMKSSHNIMFIALFQSTHKLVLGGVITALGVCIMHYLGNL
jgi:NO-binding membrane sensor protein with MHYT domain